MHTKVEKGEGTLQCCVDICKVPLSMEFTNWHICRLLRNCSISQWWWLDAGIFCPLVVYTGPFIHPGPFLSGPARCHSGKFKQGPFLIGPGSAHHAEDRPGQARLPPALNTILRRGCSPRRTPRKLENAQDWNGRSQILHWWRRSWMPKARESRRW